MARQDRYGPGFISEEYNSLELNTELYNIKNALDYLYEGRREVFYAVPEKPEAGMIVFADGTDWDPGYGRGYYEYDGSTWNSLNNKLSLASLLFTPKNMVVNGDLSVDQFGNTSWTPTVAYADIHLFDHIWPFFAVGNRCTIYKDSVDVPTLAEAGVRFDNSLHIDVTTTNAAMEAAVGAGIEGYAGRAVYDTGNEFITFSFWMKSNLAGASNKFSIGFRTYSNAESYVHEFNLAAADTWEKVVVTVPLDFAGTTNMYQNRFIDWNIAVSQAGSATSTLDQWVAGNTPYGSGIVNLFASTSNYVKMTGFMCEAGDKATAWQEVAPQLEWLRCYRYKQAWRHLQYYPIDGAIFRSSASGTVMNSQTTKFLTPMRAAPTLLSYGGVTPNALFRRMQNHASAGSANLTIANQGAHEFNWRATLAGVNSEAYWAESNVNVVLIFDSRVV